MEQILLRIYASTHGSHNQKLSAVCNELVKRIKSRHSRRIAVRKAALESKLRAMQGAYVQRLWHLRRAKDTLVIDTLAHFLARRALIRARIEGCRLMLEMVALRTTYWRTVFMANWRVGRSLDVKIRRLLHDLGFSQSDGPTVSTAAEAAFNVCEIMEHTRRIIEPTFNVRGV